MENNLSKIDRLEISMDNLKSLIDDAVQAGRRAEKTDFKKVKNPFYSETEAKLYKYPMLKYKVVQDRLDIEDLQKEMQLGCAQKSKDIVYIPNGGTRLDPDERQEALIAEKLVSMKKTEREIEKIEKALDKVKNYKGYEIIKLKYLDRIEPDEEIMAIMDVGKTTFYQWKNRIINDLSVIFFGE